MIVDKLVGGLGNQLFRYASGCRLANKRDTQLKIDITYYDDKTHAPYFLDMFNITAPAATPQEISYTKNFFVGKEPSYIFTPEALDYPDNTYLDGAFENERYFADIADIIRREFSFKEPLGVTAQKWREKILAAECSVSMHIRHGDFLDNTKDIFAILPLEYYRDCLNRLKQQYKNLTVFIFSNNLQWCKENLRLDVPTEFIDGCKDYEDLCLMSLCKHNIIANSTFSWWAAWLNKNPDKKVFVPVPTSIVGTNKTYRHFSAKRDENSPLEMDRWIKVPFDLKRQMDVIIRPHFSLLLVVNNDRDTLEDTLNSLLAQEHKYFDIIIIDNASFDGSNKICRRAVEKSDKVTLIRLCDKVSNGAAWNLALSVAQGRYVMFFKCGDKIFPDALILLYPDSEERIADVVSSVAYFREDDGGTFSAGGKNFSLIYDEIFRGMKNELAKKSDKMTALEFLTGKARFVPIATKIFYRKFLTDNAIRFNESLTDSDAEFSFMKEIINHTDEMIFLPTPFYVAPKI